MNNAARHILFIAISAGWLGMVYFIGLMLHLPVIATAIITIVSLLFFYRKLDHKAHTGPERLGFFASALLVIAIVLFTNKAGDIATPYGGWDAWSIWNLHAKYLADADHWQNLFLNKSYAHPDYPLAVPSVIAFFARLISPVYIKDIAFGLHFLVTLCIPLLIYLLVHQRSLLIAGAALLLMATDTHFITQGMAQYADTLLALFFLCAFVAIDQYWEDRNMVAVTGFMLGCCMWTKNEGVILSAVFILFYFRMLLHASRVWYFLIGIALPLAVWLLFKLWYAPQNEIAWFFGSNTLANITDPGRYYKVAGFFLRNLYQYFSIPVVMLAFYIVRCIARRQRPHRQVLLIISCGMVYACIYITTQQELSWLLSTSQDRLIHQLMPALIYTLAMQFSAKGRHEQTSGWSSAHQRPQ